ncbi:MAG: 1-acyl-sn-glycerol-3-phosphate acyltransferase [Candidatus Omnitrophica bacterium]|nr:1-acyl-sn-glycerol-3-phosphate acyltransferase [Candidatus Omnitrophota bacterium]
MTTLCYRLSKVLLLLILKVILRIKIKVKGLEFIPKKGAFLLISNHLSYLDPPIVGISCPRPLIFLARKDLFDIRFLGPWMRAVGVVPLMPESGDIKAIKGAIKALKKGNVVAVFPEGARQAATESSFQNIKKGFLLLAKKPNVPIVVAKVTGSEKAWPRDSKCIKRGTEVEVSFSKPLMIGSFEDYEQELKTLKAVFAKL